MKILTKKLLHSKLGFSLVELMVGAGLMGIVSLVMMTSVQTTQTAKKKVNQDQVIETATLKLRQVLNKIRLPDTPVDVLTCKGPVNIILWEGSSWQRGGSCR